MSDEKDDALLDAMNVAAKMILERLIAAANHASAGKKFTGIIILSLPVSGKRELTAMASNVPPKEILTILDVITEKVESVKEEKKPH